MERAVKNKLNKKVLETRKAKGESFGGTKPPSPKRRAEREQREKGLNGDNR